MVLLANVALTISRATPGGASGSTLRAVATNVWARVEPFPIDMQLTPGGRTLEYRYVVMFDPGTDVRENDVLDGWNPRGVTPAPRLVVRKVDDYAPIMAHTEAWCADYRSREH